jgi:hypothetical protein
MLMLSGCGAVTAPQYMCTGGDLKPICQAMFGYGADNEARDDAQDKLIRSLDNKLIDHINNQQMLLNIVQSNIAAMSVVISTLDAEEEDDVAALEQLIANQLALSSSLASDISSLQDEVDDQAADIAELETHESITEFIDPCGDSTGYDEIVLRTRSGKLVAFFENGTKRFLSLLTPGSYMTTDSFACSFNVTSEGLLCDSTGCH